VTEPALSRIEAENFRSLRNVGVDLGAVNVLVGPNGAGKSNLLDVIEFLGDSVREDLAPALRNRGGYDRVYFRGETSGSIRIRVYAHVTSYSSEAATDEYSLTFRRQRMKPHEIIARWETFKFKRYQGPGRRITINGSKVEITDTRADDTQRGEQITLGLQSDSLGLSTLPRLSDKQGGAEIRRVAEMFATFKVFSPHVERAREPSIDISSSSLNADASNLASFLYWLREEHPDRCEALEEDARHMIPGFDSLDFVEIGGPRPATVAVIEESGLESPTHLADASFGSIRALALLALLYDPDPPLLTCIEEIDHGLHPYVFDRLMDRVREASQRTQFLIATHSPALVNRLSASELIVCERGSDGASRIPAADPVRVKEIERAANGELGLGEIWFTGTLGGVPA